MVKEEAKQTETLDKALVSKNFYRVRDAYAIKLYGQDEGMSFDVANQRLFDQTLPLRMVSCMGLVLVIWLSRIIFKGSYPIS